MEKMKRVKANHEFGALYDKNSEILILGSFPSVASRAQGFYYAHPQNRFWKVLAKIYGEALPESVAEKKRFLLEKHIALWDVIASCEITASSDSSISDVCANDISWVIAKSRITAVYTNGKTAFSLYEKHCEEKTSLRAVCLPSTSPANAAYSLDKLVEIWESAIKKPGEIPGN